MKKRIVVITCLLSILFVSTVCMAFPYSGAGPISVTQSWKSYEMGTKNGTGKTFRLSNYKGYGVAITNTSFQVFAAVTGTSTETLNWSDTVKKDSVLRSYTMDNTVTGGRNIYLRYKLPASSSATSNSAYIEYYWN